MGLFPAFFLMWGFVGEGGRPVVLSELSWLRAVKGSSLPPPRMVAQGSRAQHVDHALGQQALVCKTSYFPPG